MAEGEDLVDAALAAGLEPELLLVAGEDVEPRLLDAVSTLGSGTRVIGVFPQAWSRAGGKSARNASSRSTLRCHRGGSW